MREFRRFEPVRQQVQLDRGQAEAGPALEGELAGAGLGYLGHGRPELGAGRFEPGQGGGGRGQLGFLCHQAEALADDNPVFDPRGGEFPTVGDQALLGFEVLDQVRRQGAACVGVSGRRKQAGKSKGVVPGL